MESARDILEQQNLQALVYDLRTMPQIDLPRHWFGLKKKPAPTTPSAWREAFTLELNSTTDELARSSFTRVLKLIDLAEECGATNLNFKMNFEGHIKTLSLVGIWFPKNTMVAMMSEFQRRLAEI